jgi:hypothetical protein
MSQIILNVSEDEARLLSERAQEYGYETVEAYLRAIAEIQFEDDLGLGFKQAFKDALQGKFLTEDEFWQRMADDE